MATATQDPISEARARWTQLDQSAKSIHAETEQWVTRALNDFRTKNGREVSRGDALFGEIGARFETRDKARAEADNARDALDILARAHGVASGMGADSPQGSGPAPRAGAALVEMLRTNPNAAAGAFSASLPSLIAPLLEGRGQMTPRAAFDGQMSGTAAPYVTEQGILAMPGRKRSILDLLGPGQPTSSLGGDVVNYLKQTVRTINAAVVAPLADKPESIITITRSATELVTVAHITEQIPRQLLVSYPELMPFVDETMGAGVLEKCESLAVNGTGAGGQPTGILNTSGINTISLGGLTRLAAIRRAVTVLELQNIVPDAVAFNPNDFQDLELELDNDGRFLIGNPTGAAPASVWRMRAVSSTALAEGTVLVGNFRLATKWWDGVSILRWTDAVGSDAKENAVRVIAEQGFGFAVTRASYFVTITGW